MATTLQDQNRAKFLELRASGASVADARNATYGPPPVVADATPNPVTPVTPVVASTDPESATKQTNIAQREANIASRQATPITPVTTPAPVVPVTPTPTETAPVTPSPATTTHTQTPFQQAQAESEKIKAQNEAQMKLNTQQADLKAKERQQVAQETAQANTPVNQKDVLNALVSGVSVAPQNTQEYRNAQMQYKNYQKFATMSPSQLVDNMKMGEIGTETAQLLASNPNYIKAKEDFDKFKKNQSINNMIKSVAEGATGKTTEVDHYQNASDAIAKKLGINETNSDAFARIVSQDPETLQLTKTVSSLTKQMNDTVAKRNAVYEELKAQYPTLSASAIMTLMAGRTKEDTAYINTLGTQISEASANLKIAMEMAKSEYEATKEDIALQALLAKEDRAMENALALSQAQFDQKIAQQAQSMGTPELAIPDVIDQYAQLGVMATVSPQEHIARAKKFIAKGGTLGDYISQMQKDFQNKDTYKAKFGVKTEAPTTKEIDIDGKKVTVQWDPTKSEWKPVQGATIERELAKQKYGSTPAVRNFNPGNIMDTGFGGRKVAGERFTVFDTPAEGFNALVTKIKNIQAGNSKVYSPDMTLLQYISKYAPSSDNNNPQGYANAIANNLGISINTKIGQIDPVKLAEEHARHEDGQSYNMLKDLGIIGGGVQSNAIGQYTDTQKNVMAGMDAKNISPQDAKILDQNGLKAEDIYNYKAQQKVGKWSQGLDDTEFKRVNSIIDDTSTNPVTKTFMKSQEAYNFATKASIGDNATDNQALIYAFAKAMDPDSVVREGEYATVQKYSQTWGDKFGMNINRILNGQEFISSEAKKNLVNTIKSKYQASKESYESLRNTQIKKINDIAGKDIGSTALPSDVMELVANPVDKWSAIGDILSKALSGKPKQ